MDALLLLAFLVLLVLKLVGAFALSWAIVCLPLVVIAVYYVVILILLALLGSFILKSGIGNR